MSSIGNPINNRDEYLITINKKPVSSGSVDGSLVNYTTARASNMDY